MASSATVASTSGSAPGGSAGCSTPHPRPRPRRGSEPARAHRSRATRGRAPRPTPPAERRRGRAPPPRPQPAAHPAPCPRPGQQQAHRALRPGSPRAARRAHPAHPTRRRRSRSHRGRSRPPRPGPASRSPRARPPPRPERPASPHPRRASPVGTGAVGRASWHRDRRVLVPHPRSCRRRRLRASVDARAPRCASVGVRRLGRSASTRPLQSRALPSQAPPTERRWTHPARSRRVDVRQRDGGFRWPRRSPSAAATAVDGRRPGALPRAVIASPDVASGPARPGSAGRSGTRPGRRTRAPGQSRRPRPSRGSVPRLRCGRRQRMSCARRHGASLADPSGSAPARRDDRLGSAGRSSGSAVRARRLPHSSTGRARRPPLRPGRRIRQPPSDGVGAEDDRRGAESTAPARRVSSRGCV